MLFGCIDRATIKGTSLGENMATGIDISEFIVASPDICNARPRIAGTRITIQSLVMDHKTGMSAEAIAREYPQLNKSGSLSLSYANWGVGSSALDTAIYQRGDLIGVVQDNTSIALTSYYFQFV